MPRKKSKPLISKPAMDFTALVEAIRKVHEQSASLVNRVVNTSLTIRNWLIGDYIHHYELHGADRAQYGARLMEKLADALQVYKIPSTDRQRLYSYLSFYRVYPQIAEAIPPEWIFSDPFEKNIISNIIVRTLTGKLPADSNKIPIVRTVSGQLQIHGKQLLDRLSFSHLDQLTAMGDSLKRAFYEIECIRGNWSVRTLKRQIASLYFERSGLSTDKNKLAAMVQATAEQAEAKLAIRDPLIFEFLGLNPKVAVSESDLEDALPQKKSHEGPKKRRFK